jgi:hypothetical protein
MSFTSDFVLCPIFVRVLCACDYLLSLVVVDMFSTSDFIICPTFVSASRAHDYVFFPIANIDVFLKNYQLIIISSTCDIMVFVFEPRKGTNPKSPIRDVLKSHFLDLNDKEVENVNNGNQRNSNHVELWVKNAFDEWNFFCNLDTTRSIVDF